TTKTKCCCDVCGTEFTLFELVGHVDKSIIEEYNSTLIYLTLLEEDDIVVCPNCTAAIEIDPLDKKKERDVFCQHCQTAFSINKKPIKVVQPEQPDDENLSDDTSKYTPYNLQGKSDFSLFFKKNIDVITNFVQRSYSNYKNNYYFRGDLPLFFYMNPFFGDQNTPLKKLISSSFRQVLTQRDCMKKSCFMCWHGTWSYENATGIMQNGFDVRRRSGQAFGRGEYFGNDISVCYGYGSYLILTLVLEGPAVSTFSFGFVVDNKTTETYCLPLGFVTDDQKVIGSFKRVKIFQLRINTDLYEEINHPKIKRIKMKSKYSLVSRTGKSSNLSSKDSDTIGLILKSNCSSEVSCRLDIGECVINVKRKILTCDYDVFSVICNNQQ
ncbi:hypothetical protein EIN_390480, partial [Entamoeba invadens IP1]